jgi:hypothetical protein
MFQSTPVTGRNRTEEVTPLPCLIIPLKGEVSNRKVFSMNKILRKIFLPTPEKWSRREAS